MASTKLYLIILSFSLFLTSNSPAPVVAQECPYPCYPPPTGGGSGGGGGNTPTTTTYPPPSQTGYNYPPPSSIFPYNPPNPNYYGDGPPTPDPIVPWFPYYYKKPPHNPDRSSSTGGRIGSTAVIFLIIDMLINLAWIS